eukprot:3940557-Rhodomonas_salina.5
MLSLTTALRLRNEFLTSSFIISDEKELRHLMMPPSLSAPIFLQPRLRHIRSGQTELPREEPQWSKPLKPVVVSGPGIPVATVTS